MVAFLRRRIIRLAVVVALSLIFFVFYQLSYTDTFARTGKLSESVRIINGCTPDSHQSLHNPHPISHSRIPNIIHQLWKTADIREYSKDVEASRDSWKTMFETYNYTVKLWTDDDILKLIKAHYSWLLPTYDSYPYNIQRADMARLLVVHHEGGIYSDLDVYPSSAEEIHCLQYIGLQAIFSPMSGTLGLSNHFFMAERGSPFLQWVLYEAKRRGSLASQRLVLPYLRVLWSTGPIMLTAAFREYSWLYGTLQDDIGLLDEGYGQAAILHAAGRSWHGLDGHALNYIADHA